MMYLAALLTSLFALCIELVIFFTGELFFSDIEVYALLITSVVFLAIGVFTDIRNEDNNNDNS